MPAKGNESEGMKQAIAAVTDKRKTKRMTVPAAAKEFGVAQNSIYRKPAYKLWRKKQKQAAVQQSDTGE